MELIFSGAFLGVLAFCAWHDFWSRQVHDVPVALLWALLAIGPPGGFAAAGMAFAAFFLGNSLYGTWRGVFPLSWTDLLGIAAYAGACSASGWLLASVSLLPGALALTMACRQNKEKEVPVYAILAAGYWVYLMVA